MACERYREALTELAAGAPAPAGLNAHLAGCAACRQELDALRRALEAVDADLRQLLATEPSPALAARIRQAAAEPEPGSVWRPTLWIQAFGAAAVLAAVAFVLLRGQAPTPSHVAALPPPASEANGAPLPAPEVPPTPKAPALAPSASAVAAHVPASASARRAAPPDPEVLVPPGQVETLLRLAALVNRQRLAPPGLGAAGQASPDLAEPPAIDVRSVDIKPLEIVPLDPAEDSGT